MSATDNNPEATPTQTINRNIASIDSMMSRVEMWGEQDAYACISLDRADLVRQFQEMKENGENAQIVERKIRVMGLTIPVFVLIDR